MNMCDAGGAFKKRRTGGCDSKSVGLMISIRGLASVPIKMVFWSCSCH